MRMISRPDISDLLSGGLPISRVRFSNGKLSFSTNNSSYKVRSEFSDELMNLYIWREDSSLNTHNTPIHYTIDIPEGTKKIKYYHTQP